MGIFTMMARAKASEAGEANVRAKARNAMRATEAMEANAKGHGAAGEP